MDENGWMPIETAPKDGTRVLLYWPDYAYDEPSGPLVDIGWHTNSYRRARGLVSYWTNTDEADNYLADRPEHQPTRWQPLPKP